MVPISVIRAEFEALRGLYGLRDDSKIVSQRQDLSEFDVDLGQFALIRDGVISKDASAIASILPVPSSHTGSDDLRLEFNAKLEQFYCLLDMNGDGQLTHEDFERACGRPNLMLLTQARHSHHPHSAAWHFESPTRL